MSSNHHIFVLALFSILGVTLANNDLIVGTRHPGDGYIESYYIVRNPDDYDRKITFAKTLVGDRYSPITMIHAHDRHEDGNGATATVIAGGIGSSFVTMNFVSEKSHGINFKVDLYGMV